MLDKADLARLQKEADISDVTLARLLTGRGTEGATKRRILAAAERLSIRLPLGFTEDSRKGGEE